VDLSAWVPTFISLVMAVAAFAGRNLIQASIEQSVQHKYDAKIEGLRSELRNSEETFKSELRSKEAEISLLREGVLSGRATERPYWTNAASRTGWPASHSTPQGQSRPKAGLHRVAREFRRRPSAGTTLTRLELPALGPAGLYPRAPSR
jgi:hypothetical protein